MESSLNVEVGFIAAFIRNLDRGGVSRHKCMYLHGKLEQASSNIFEKLAAIWHGLGGQMPPGND